MPAQNTSPKKKNRFFNIRNFIILAAVLSLGLIFQGWVVSRQLQDLVLKFRTNLEFLPNKIYSDVTKIKPLQSKRRILDILDSLSYNIIENENVVKFELHPIQYPVELIHQFENPRDLHRTSQEANNFYEVVNEAKNYFPDGHIPIELIFDDSNELLQQILIHKQEVDTLFLEPELIATLGSPSDQREAREVLHFEEVPKHLWQAVVAVEDQNFYSHFGIDLKGIARAIWINLKSGKLVQGGSTITQQLVKNLMVRKGKSLIKKFNETLLALAIERKFTKNEILARYLNEVYLGQNGPIEIHGMAEGARHFFDKTISNITLGEAALLIGLIRGPAYYSPYRYPQRALDRQKVVLDKMIQAGFISENEAKLATEELLRFTPQKTVFNKAPFFTETVEEEAEARLRKLGLNLGGPSGLKIYTTLNLWANKVAIEKINSQLKTVDPKDSFSLESVLISVEPHTGKIRTLIGGRDFQKSSYNRAIKMYRQAGSTFKPIVVASALEKGEALNSAPYSGAYPLEDSPLKVSLPKNKAWEPKNYENEYYGWIPLRKMLAHSVNTAASRLFLEVGYEWTSKTARNLGITSRLPNVPSLGLGSNDVEPLELLQAYQVFANHGAQLELTTIRLITQYSAQLKDEEIAHFEQIPRQVISPSTADLMTDLLSSTFTDGTATLSAKNAGFFAPAAGKTGTTSDYRDSWFIGYTPSLLTLSWVGSDIAPSKNLKKRPKLTGATAALPIWLSFMSAMTEGTPPEPFYPLQEFELVKIDAHTGKAASIFCPDSQVLLEKFTPDRMPKNSSCQPLWPESKLQYNWLSSKE